METEKLIQITAGKGPAECQLAVALTLRELLKECNDKKFQSSVIERSPGELNGTLLSVLIHIKVKHMHEWISSWEGIIQWICKSPYRKFHPRKNWFIAVHAFNPVSFVSINENEIQFQAMRSSGPGGQHVNKTQSAVRALHVPSGLSVTAMDARSQHENKKLALMRLKEKLKNWELEKKTKQFTQQWMNHIELERGNPKRIYHDKQFKLKKNE